MTYIKYNYWLERDVAARLGEKLEREGLDVFEVKKAVCIPLSHRYEIGIIPPEAWSEYELCRRQFSWYHQSEFRGKTLLISSIDLSERGCTAETIIREADSFQPPELPDYNALNRLATNPQFLLKKPEQWDRVDNETLKKWLKIMRLDNVDEKEIFLSHTANHANFIAPSYFINNNDAPAPYSIGPSSRVCSACLEFFNIIGAEYSKKYVVPCPGAVMFAGLKANVYYEVKNGQGAVIKS